MNLRSVDLNLFLVFDTVFRERSISKAAERLSLAQPTVSNALARLRDRFDDPLFTRVGSRMVPTARAISLAQPVREALDLLERGVRDTDKFDHASTARRFVMSVEDYGEAVIFPRFMEHLNAIAPKVSFCFRSEPRVSKPNELREGELDFSLSYFALSEPGFQNECVLTDDLITLAAARPSDANEEWLDIRAYAAARHVVLAPRSGNWPMIDLALAKRGFKRRIAAEVPHFASMPLLIQSGDLLGTLPGRMALLYANHFNLRAHRVPLRMPNFPIYLTWHVAADDDPAHRWLRDTLIEFCRSGRI